MSEVVHRCPIGDAGVMPCCGRTPFDIPTTDRLSLDWALVTCQPEEDEDGRRHAQRRRMEAHDRDMRRDPGLRRNIAIMGGDPSL